MKKIACLIVFLAGAYNISSQWVSQSTPTSEKIFNILFVNTTTGFIISERNSVTTVLFKTTNASITWDSTGEDNNDAEGIFFADENTGWMYGRYLPNNFSLGKVWKTTNCGTNWSFQTFDDSSNVSSLFFIDQNNGFFGENRYTPPAFVYKTTNGGNAWTKLLGIPAIVTDIEKIYFLNNNTGWISCHTRIGQDARRSSILFTNDAGNTWSLISNFVNHNYSLPNMIFLNENTGYLSGVENVSHPGDTPEPLLFKTTNGGFNWVNINLLNPPPYYHQITGMYFKDVNTGWIAGNRAHVSITTNGGANWIVQNSGLSTDYDFWDVSFTSNYGWIASDNGTILKTTNGGFPVEFSVTGTVRYEDNNQLVTSGYVKAFKHSSSGGDLVVLDSVPIQPNGSYTLIITQDTVDLMAFDDDEDAPGFVPTYYPSTIEWQNAGRVYPNGNLSGLDIEVFRVSNDWISPGKISGGVFLNTAESNGFSGIKDGIIYAKIGNNFKGYSVSASDGGYGIDSLQQGSYQIICNRMGFPTRTRNEFLGVVNLTGIDFIFGSGLVGINEEPGIPDKFSLAQNYPNPFNPATIFKFGIPKQGNVKLIIYDVLGREVDQLINNELKAGYHTIHWDASSYPSGIYFYKLVSDDFSETKKMVLVK